MSEGARRHRPSSLLLPVMYGGLNGLRLLKEVISDKSKVLGAFYTDVKNIGGGGR